VVCAQLCGNGHSQMRAELHVDSEADYKKWYDFVSSNTKPKMADVPSATTDATLVASH
jgi:heme/copper-type cytochrome/quinol oxidase subunit 2